MSKVKPNICDKSGVISYKHRTLLHRKDGPAVIYPEGEIAWWYLGVRIVSWRDFKSLTQCTDEELMFLKLKYGEDTFG